MPVNQPLLLISQVQRSGGTLLSQLFDGHPQVHAHPHELKIGYPEKWELASHRPASGRRRLFQDPFRDAGRSSSSARATARAATPRFPATSCCRRPYSATSFSTR